MGLLPRGGGGGGGNGEGCGCGGGVNIGIVMGANGKPSALSSPDLEAVKKELEKKADLQAMKDALGKKADLVGGKVPPEQLPPIGDSLDRGLFPDEAALTAAHPTDVAGAHATVVATGTMWLWNVAEAKWEDSGQAPAGTPGPQGPQGEPGPTGPQGPAGSSIDVVNALDSDRTDAALSAAQGKVLKGLIDTGGGGITAAQLAAAIATGLWTERTLPAGDWNGVCWSPQLGLFCAVGNGGKAATSPDGVTWTERTLPVSTWLSVCWSPQLGLFCAVGNGGKAATSPDGVTWTERTLPADTWRGVCWSPQLGLFCAVGNSKAATSPDGVTWTERTLPADNWRGVCWSPEQGLFCAVRYGGKAATSFPLKL